MNKISRRLYIPFIFLACLLSLQARAATVDINSRINDLGNPVQIFLDAGTYTVSNVGTADSGAYDGWSNWSSTTCGDASGCPITVPTSATGFRSAYNIISPDITAVQVDGLDLTPINVEPTGVDLFTDFFFIGNRYHVDDTLVYPNAMQALANARSSQFTLAVSGLVGFAINDAPLSDNRDGVSLLLSEVSAIPIPAAAWLFGTALIGFVGYSRRRKIS
jgi:hypothetical protein